MFKSMNLMLAFSMVAFSGLLAVEKADSDGFVSLFNGESL